MEEQLSEWLISDQLTTSNKGFCSELCPERHLYSHWAKKEIMETDLPPDTSVNSPYFPHLHIHWLNKWFIKGSTCFSARESRNPSCTLALPHLALFHTYKQWAVSHPLVWVQSPQSWIHFMITRAVSQGFQQS